MKKKIIIIVCIILLIIFIPQMYAQTPFAGIKSLIWEYEHRDADKTYIDFRLDENFFVLEGEVAEYKGDTYYYDTTSYEDEDGFEIYPEEVCGIDQNGNRFILEGLNEYINEQMPFSKGRADGQYLIIIGENYSPSYWPHEECVYTTGEMEFYNGGTIFVFDMEEKKMVKAYSVKDGKIIYADKEQYVVMAHENVSFYQMDTGEIFREEIIDLFEKDKMYIIGLNEEGNQLEIYIDESFQLLESFEL